MSKQYFKAVYYSDFPSEESRDKSITIAFSEPELPYYSRVKEMSTHEFKELIGIQSYLELSVSADKQGRSINQVVKRLIKQNLGKVDKSVGFSEKDVTFENSKEVPFQRWYPYIEGYSPDFVTSLIKDYAINNTLIYEPFAGTGTTLFAADSMRLSTVYSEVNPLLQFLVQVKVKILKSPEVTRYKLAQGLRALGRDFFGQLDAYPEDATLDQSYIALFGESKYFINDTYRQVLQLRAMVDAVKLENELLGDVLSIAIFSCLLPVSLLKKMGDVRFKTPSELEKDSRTFEDVLPQKLADMAADILNFEYKLHNSPEFIIANAKNIGRVNQLKIGAVITSPPYLNGTNYFRNTKLELWFLRYLRFENDLRHFRDQVLTSGINDVKKGGNDRSGQDITQQSGILKDVLKELVEKTYDARIPVMAKSYFQEMYQVFNDVRPHLLKGSKVLIDIGDSVFCGVHIKTDEILIEILGGLGYTLLDNKTLRKRRSKNQEILTQSLIVLEFIGGKAQQLPARYTWKQSWDVFQNTLPHQEEPFSKKNWGHSRHSLCSYQGKLKPAIAHHLVETFVPANGSMLDPFAGVGTIPFEAALSGKLAYGIDISLPAYYISAAKVASPSGDDCQRYIAALEHFILNNRVSVAELENTRIFGFNKTLAEYYQEETLKEILLARRFVKEHFPVTPAEMLVVASLFHILHGNRPYALSRRSHPIVPYAPTGEFIYKNLVEKLKEKVSRSYKEDLPLNFKPGRIFHQDITHIWPQEINNLDAIITSPPFFDSTRFYLANWIRIWFSGWSENDFKYKINSFIEEKQKIDFAIYHSIFRQSRERLKKDGVFVLHLGKSVKCDMAVELQKVGKRWFKTADLFDESVAHCASHGTPDKGTVTSHQYLVLV